METKKQKWPRRLSTSARRRQKESAFGHNEYLPREFTIDVLRPFITSTKKRCWVNPWCSCNSVSMHCKAIKLFGCDTKKTLFANLFAAAKSLINTSQFQSITAHTSSVLFLYFLFVSLGALFWIRFKFPSAAEFVCCWISKPIISSRCHKESLPCT